MCDPSYALWGGPYRLTRGLLVGNGLNMARIVPVLAAQVKPLRHTHQEPCLPSYRTRNEGDACKSAARTMLTGELVLLSPFPTYSCRAGVYVPVLP
jgi:hypothetical protein